MNTITADDPADLREKASRVYKVLDKKYPGPRILLNYRNAYELLIGVILSAQTTDRQVNEVTAILFREYPDAGALSRASLGTVEEIIRSTGFYRQKARNIIGAAARIVEVFGGEVPSAMQDLLTLPGVGRKSANVVLGHIYERPAVIVDTHFSRVVRRLGLTTVARPDGIEAELAGLVAPEHQTRFSMLINYHGRDLCFARKPACGECPLSRDCAWYAESQGIRP